MEKNEPIPAPEVEHSPEKSINASRDDDKYVDDGHDPCPDFKPIIPLPEVVQVHTGEEEEEVSNCFKIFKTDWCSLTFKII